MKKFLMIAGIILLLAGGLYVGLQRSDNKWAGVDESVVEKFAKEAGRPPRDPFINTDQGDLMLFFFLIAGTVGGFVGGYYFRHLFPPKQGTSKMRDGFLIGTISCWLAVGSVCAQTEAPSAMLAPAETAAKAPPTLWERERLSGDWGGTRSRLSENGFDVGLEYTGEFMANVSGGARRGELYQGLLKTLLDFDMEKMTGWKGGKFHVSSLWIEGTEPNDRGDIAGMAGIAFLEPSNISAYDTYRLYEAWFEQSFLDDKLAVRMGQIAVDEKIICSDYAGLFIGGTHGWPAFMSGIIPSGGAAYPVAGTGIMLIGKPIEQFELIGTVVDGDVGDQANESRNGTHFAFAHDDGVLAIVEAAWRLNQEKGAKGLPGTYKIGGWYHSGCFNDLHFDGRGASLADDGTLSGLASDGNGVCHEGNGGIYFNIDQMLWREKPDGDEGLALYCRVAPWMPSDRNPMDFYAAGGLHYKGLIPNRDQDVFGVAAAYVHVSDSLRDLQRDANRIAAAGGSPNNLSSGPLPDYEMSLEVIYQISLAPWWSLQPDFQYIFHPGGSSAIEDAIVIGLRTKIAF